MEKQNLEIKKCSKNDFPLLDQNKQINESEDKWNDLHHFYIQPNKTKNYFTFEN